MTKLYQVLPVLASAAIACATECKPKKGMFHYEKGAKCHGGFEEGKGGGKVCEGGIKAKFSAETEAVCVAENAAQSLRDQLADVAIPEESDLLPPEEVLNAIVAYDSIAELEEGFEKTVEFGGFMKAEWSCKVTYSMKDGEFQKQMECGFKGRHGRGSKSETDDIYFEEE